MCVIVDDEIRGIKVIEFFCKKVPEIQVVKTFQNPIEALQYVNNNGSVNLVFLDLRMPDLNGLQFLELLKSKAKVIMATANSEFKNIADNSPALIDYLLKPIDFDPFTKAVN